METNNVKSGIEIKKVLTAWQECKAALEAFYKVKRQWMRSRSGITHEENSSFTIIERVLRRNLNEFENRISIK